MQMSLRFLQIQLPNPNPCWIARRKQQEAVKTEYIGFNREGCISTVNGGFVEKLTYLGSSISFAESDIKMRRVKARTAIDKLSITWKFDLSDRIKQNFFQAAAVSMLMYGSTIYGCRENVLRKKLHGSTILDAEKTCWEKSYTGTA